MTLFGDYLYKLPEEVGSNPPNCIISRFRFGVFIDTSVPFIQGLLYNKVNNVSFIANIT